MSVLVIDASVAVKWFMTEDHTEAALRLLSEDNRLHAPDFILLEVDSVLCKRIRRGQIMADDGREIRAALRQFPLLLHPCSELLDVAYEMANVTGRSPYDCLYVALAIVLGAKAVTADRRLYEGLADSSFAENLLWVAGAEG